eukprot:14940559-Alexandrium_andersonii.AAC.1
MRVARERRTARTARSTSPLALAIRRPSCSARTSKRNRSRANTSSGFFQAESNGAAAAAQLHHQASSPTGSKQVPPRRRHARKPASKRQKAR